MSWMIKAVFRGLVAVVPFGLTIYVVYWIVTYSESLLELLFKRFFEPESYNAGIGLALAVVFLFLIGSLLNAILVRRLYRFGEHLISRIPLIKSIYGMLKDMMGFFTLSENQQFNQVVMVKFGEASLIGLVTRESFDDLPEGIGGEGKIAVYLPFSYQLGGYLVVVPRASVEPVEMPMGQAMRFANTAGAICISESESAICQRSLDSVSTEPPWSLPRCG